MGGLGIDEKLAQLRDPIKKWNREVFGMIDHKIIILENEIIAVEEQIHEAKNDKVIVAQLIELRVILHCSIRGKSVIGNRHPETT